MDGSGNQLLSGSRCSKDQNSRVGGSDFFHPAEDLLHHLTGTDDIIEAVTSVQLLPQVFIFPNQAGFFQRLDHLNFQPFNVEGFADVVEGSCTHRLNRRLCRGVPGNQNDTGIRRIFLHLFQDINSTDSRKNQITDNQIEWLFSYYLKGLFTRMADFHLIIRLPKQM